MLAVLIDDQEEFEIERIVGHQQTRRGLRFTVRWKGYGVEEDCALYESDMGHTADIVAAYKREHGL